MATTKVSALTAHTTTDGAEELLINDGGTSKKVTIANLLHDNSIDSDHYVDGSIDAAHIADDAIDSQHYVDRSIDRLHIAEDIINAEHLADDILHSSHYGAGSIDTEHIANDQITNALMADDAIDSDQIADGAVDLAHMSSESVDEDNLHISNSGSNGNFLQKQSGNAGGLTWAAQSIGDESVDSDAYVDGSIDTAHIGDDQVTYAKIQNVSATDRILGRDSSGAGVIEEIAVSDLLTMINVEAGADVTDATNVTAAGALMDSELAGIAAVKATTGTFLSADESKLDAIEASADVTDATNVGTVVNGKNTIWVPANAMVPTTSNGCADITAVETTSGRPDMYVLDFDKDSDEHAQFTVAFPKQWNLGTITFQVFWSGLAATTGVEWFLQGVGMGDNETIDVAYGTAIGVADDAQGAVEELLVTAESSAVTIAGTPADDDLTYFRIYRDVSTGNDDMAGDARLHGVKILYTTDALNDA